MNKEQLEKMFDDKFYNDFGSMRGVAPIATISEIKQFIFETIIPEVFKNLTLSNETCLCCQNNKQNAKELYGIKL